MKGIDTAKLVAQPQNAKVAAASHVLGNSAEVAAKGVSALASKIAAAAKPLWAFARANPASVAVLVGGYVALKALHHKAAGAR